MSSRGWVWIVWVCFIARAAFYCSVLPPWEGQDEYSHYAVIQHLALTHRFPAPVADSSREVAESMRLTPVPWSIRDPANGLLSYDEYWQLPAAERADRARRLRALPAALASQTGAARLLMYEAQQAPLYYWLMAPVYWLIHDFELPAKIWILRVVTALLTSALIPLAYLAARHIFPDVAMALGVTTAIALLPELLLSACRVGNEGLAIAFGGLAALAMLWFLDGVASTRRGALFGLTIGLALLTKAYFLALLPGALLVLLWSARRRPAVAAIAVGAIVCGWWYGRSVYLTGSVVGEQYDVAAQRSGMTLGSAVMRLDWARCFDVIATTNIWVGGWSFLVVRSWMYRVVEVVATLAAAGVALQVWRPRAELPGRRQTVLLALLYVTLVAGLCYNALAGFRSIGATGSVGYYLYALVVPEAILLTAGLARLLPERWRLAPVAFGAVTLMALEWFGTWLILLPYYTGLIRHEADGGLPTFHVTEYAGKLGTLVERLAVNKAAFLTPEVLVGLMMAFGCATAMLGGIGLWVSRGQRKEGGHFTG